MTRRAALSERIRLVRDGKPSTSAYAEAVVRDFANMPLRSYMKENGYDMRALAQRRFASLVDEHSSVSWTASCIHALAVRTVAKDEDASEVEQAVNAFVGPLISVANPEAPAQPRLAQAQRKAFEKCARQGNLSLDQRISQARERLSPQNRTTGRFLGLSIGEYFDAIDTLAATKIPAIESMRPHAEEVMGIGEEGSMAQLVRRIASQTAQKTPGRVFAEKKTFFDLDAAVKISYLAFVLPLAKAKA